MTKNNLSTKSYSDTTGFHHSTPGAIRKQTVRVDSHCKKQGFKEQEWFQKEGEGEEEVISGAYKHLKKFVFRLFSREDVNEIARGCGFRKREERQIPPFEFALCCALGAVVELRRGFASVWRLLGTAAGIKVVRSAVTQRFSEGSANFLQMLFEMAVKRVSKPHHPEILKKLEQFRGVLADDGTVLKLSPLLSKLFPANRTNKMKAAGKVHMRADIINRRIEWVKVTGERESERAVIRKKGVTANTLYIRDLGYTCYDDFADIVSRKGHILMRLKDNANPEVVRVRHGVIGPKRSIGKKLNDLEFPTSIDTFDLDARFKTSQGFIVLRVVGHYNPETRKYHCYVTDLPDEEFSVEELETLYSMRWEIELLFKLLKSSCHLDHLDTKDPNALRTHIYASLLAATILSAVVVAAAEAYGIPTNEISLLAVGIASPLFAVNLMLLWLNRKLTYDEVAAMIIRTVAVGCRDQNLKRTRKKWGILG